MSAQSPGQVLWILGLLHSGTTIFWKCFRKDTRLTCFDEPFTGALGAHFPGNNEKGTLDEFISHFAADPAGFWELYEPVELLQELDSQFTAEQERYLGCLLRCGERVVIDETHLHLHLAALAKLAPESRVIHLHRRASAFATSHLLPSGLRDTGRSQVAARSLRQLYRKHIFFSRSQLFPGMRREAVIGRHPKSRFGLLLRGAGYDADSIMRGSALVRLLAYWHYHYRHLRREGPRLFGKRFVNVPYESFAVQPEDTMRRIYNWMGMPPPPTSYPEVHGPKPAYRQCDRRWVEAARTAGFSDEEINTLL